ncbi:hypothetical protein LBMAG42_22240 [Deltaproteobacteria bacterium]|nr:hypothetical protein LBMAG42_22240 [Deltaproteobacteria bacterium]
MVVPHPVPALGIEGDERVRVAAHGVRRDAVGAHELIFGAHGSADPRLLAFAAHRIAELRRDPRLRGFSIFRVDAPGRHPIWELLALPTDIAPSNPAPWRDVELENGARVVEANHGAVAIAAWAPRVPFETWVLPTRGGEEFPAGYEEVSALADRVLARMAERLGGPEIVVTVEFGTPWRLVLRPRVEVSLRTEGVGLPGHGVLPERAVGVLRG